MDGDGVTESVRDADADRDRDREFDGELDRVTVGDTVADRLRVVDGVGERDAVGELDTHDVRSRSYTWKVDADAAPAPELAVKPAVKNCVPNVICDSVPHMGTVVR